MAENGQIRTQWSCFTVGAFRKQSVRLSILFIVRTIQGFVSSQVSFMFFKRPECDWCEGGQWPHVRSCDYSYSPYCLASGRNFIVTRLEL